MIKLSKQATEAWQGRVLNEIGSRILNEANSDKVLALRQGTKASEHTNMLFACECDSKACLEHISLSPEEYARAHSKNMHFIVIPSHVRLDIEEVLISFKYYCVVKKFFPRLVAAQ